MWKHSIKRYLKRALRMFTVLALVMLSPLLEKNPQKVLASRAPVVFSITRIVICAFAIGMFRQMLHAGVVSWPEVTLCVALIFSNHIAAALEKLPAADVVAFGRAIVDHLGVGDARTIGSLYPRVEEASTPERDPDDERVQW